MSLCIVYSIPEGVMIAEESKDGKFHDLSGNELCVAIVDRSNSHEDVERIIDNPHLRHEIYLSGNNVCKYVNH
jgi:hypothetical protein